MTFDLGGADRDAWRSVNQGFSAPPPVAKRPPWWRRHARLLALSLVADLVVGLVMWQVLQHDKNTPEYAVQQAVTLVVENDWVGLRGSLCLPDRLHYTAQDLANAGLAAKLVLRGVEGFTVTQVSEEPSVRFGAISMPTRRVDGEVTATLGPPSKAHVTVVKEASSWHVCLSIGGYGLAAVNVNVPLQPSFLG